jgi:hypothetical protein
MHLQYFAFCYSESDLVHAPPIPQSPNPPTPENFGQAVYICYIDSFLNQDPHPLTIEYNVAHVLLLISYIIPFLKRWQNMARLSNLKLHLTTILGQTLQSR